MSNHVNREGGGQALGSKPPQRQCNQYVRGGVVHPLKRQPHIDTGCDARALGAHSAPVPASVQGIGEFTFCLRSDLSFLSLIFLTSTFGTGRLYVLMFSRPAGFSSRCCFRFRFLLSSPFCFSTTARSRRACDEDEVAVGEVHQCVRRVRRAPTLGIKWQRELWAIRTGWPGWPGGEAHKRGAEQVRGGCTLDGGRVVETVKDEGDDVGSRTTHSRHRR